MLVPLYQLRWISCGAPLAITAGFWPFPLMHPLLHSQHNISIDSTIHSLNKEGDNLHSQSWICTRCSPYFRYYKTISAVIYSIHYMLQRLVWQSSLQERYLKTFFCVCFLRLKSLVACLELGTPKGWRKNASLWQIFDWHFTTSYPTTVVVASFKPNLKALMPITFSSPRAQPEVVYFFVSNESPYFSNCKSEILPSNSLQFGRYGRKCEVNWYTNK